MVNIIIGINGLFNKKNNNMVHLTSGEKLFLVESSEILIFAIYLVWKGHVFFVEKA